MALFDSPCASHPTTWASRTVIPGIETSMGVSPSGTRTGALPGTLFMSGMARDGNTGFLLALMDGDACSRRCCNRAIRHLA